MFHRRQFLHAASLLALALPAGAIAREGGGLNEVRSRVESSGRVKNIVRDDDSSYHTVHAFSWAIELENATARGVFSSVNTDREFRHGQRFRLRIESATDLYIYVLVYNADGSQVVLLPDTPQTAPLVRAGQVIHLPDQGAFYFTPPAGSERIRLIASPKRLNWVVTSQLFRLQQGQPLTERERAIALRDQSKRESSIQQAMQDLEKMKHTNAVESVLRSIDTGGGVKGAEVVAAEKVEHANLVTYASVRADARAVMIADIVLRHAD